MDARPSRAGNAAVNWVVDNLDLIGELTLVHLRQSIIADRAGLRHLASRSAGSPAGTGAARGVLLTVTGLLYTIPSLALLSILPPFCSASADLQRDRT